MVSSQPDRDAPVPIAPPAPSKQPRSPKFQPALVPNDRSASVRGAALVVFVYLLATLPVLVGLGAAPFRAGWLVAHLVAIAATGWAVRSRRAGLLADWLPLGLTPFFYAELPTLMAAVGGGSTVYHDATVQRWEQALFGAQPSHALAGALPWLWLSETLHFGYFAYYALIFGPPLVLYLRGRRDEFAATALAVMGTFVACYVAFILFPVEGPRYAWPAPPGIPDGPVRRLVLSILVSGSSRGAAFPSSHAAVSVAASVAALRFQPRIGILVALCTALLLVGAVYGGFHYGIDMIAGALVGLGVALAAVRSRGSAQSA